MRYSVLIPPVSPVFNCMSSEPLFLYALDASRYFDRNARPAVSVDTQDLGSCVEGRGALLYGMYNPLVWLFLVESKG